MRKEIRLIFSLIFVLAFHVKGIAATGEFMVLDTVDVALSDGAWKVLRYPGTFEPAGWEHTEAPALTRVQAVRLGLVVNEWLDERFDPVKGKIATLKYYGIPTPKVERSSWSTDAGDVLLSDLADFAGVPLRIIENANPHLRRDVLPRGAILYGVGVEVSADQERNWAAKQKGYQEELVAQYERRRKQIMSFLPDPQTHESITYVVRSGDYLGRISTKTGASIEDLRKWNRINGNTIYAGQKLVVWVPKSTSSKVNEQIAAQQETTESVETPVILEKSSESKELATAAPEDCIVYRVKEGDTLWGIASKFPGVSADNIKEWNKIDELIKAGQSLKINKQMISDYSPDKYPSTL
ncbi:MAG: hypothetical protein RL754_299 [Bacteroidota bacterium]|jgi:LysM repeat protein